MRKTLAGAAIAAALISSNPAAAATFMCTDQITGVGQSHSGVLFARTSFGVFSICSLNVELGGTTPKTCEGWMADLLTARGTNQKISFYFDTGHARNSDITDAACTTANFFWKDRTPYFLELTS